MQRHIGGDVNGPRGGITYASIALTSGGVPAIAYFRRGSFDPATMTESGPRDVVDDGRPAADEPWHPQSFPGAQSSIAFTPSGKIELAYQDATPVDLVIASWNPATNTRASRRSLRTQGSAGFYPRLALDGTGNAYISSATIKAATAQLAANQLFVDVTRAP